MKERPLYQSIAAAFIAAHFFAFIFWLGRKSGQIHSVPKVEHDYITKDVTETKKLQRMYDSVVAEYTSVITQIKKAKSTHIKTTKQNEINKKIALSASDSIAFYLNDSLRSRYYEVFNKGSN
jgi:hypothetical protein